MSAAPLAGSAQPAGRLHPQPQPQLRVVPAAAARAPRAPFVLLVLGLLALGLLALLMLNTVLAQDAFRLHDLQRRGLLVTDRQQQLDQVLSRQRSPSLLASRALALGMVPGSARSFTRLADGRVVAELTAASPGRPVAPVRVAPVRPVAPAKPVAAKPVAAKPTARATPAPTPAASPR